MYAHSSGSYTFPDGYLHNGYLIFIEVLSIRNSVMCYKLESKPEEHCGFQTKAHVGQSWSCKYSAVVSDYTSVENQENLVATSSFLESRVNEQWIEETVFHRNCTNFTGTVQIFKMDMLKRYNFFINVLIFTCGLYSVASLEDNGECLYNVEWCTWHGSSQYYNI